jgi:hypothetical protein
MKQLRWKVRSQVREQVWWLVKAQVWDQGWFQVGSQVDDQVLSLVEAQVWEQVKNQVWWQVWFQVGDLVWDQVEEQVRSQVRDQVSGDFTLRSGRKAELLSETNQKGFTKVKDCVSNKVNAGIYENLMNLDVDQHKIDILSSIVAQDPMLKDMYFLITGSGLLEIHAKKRRTFYISE